jgi:hypothetical protein
MVLPDEAIVMAEQLTVCKTLRVIGKAPCSCNYYLRPELFGGVEVATRLSPWAQRGPLLPNSLESKALARFLTCT